MTSGGEKKIQQNLLCHMVFPCGSAGKESSCNAGGLGSIPGLVKSPGGSRILPIPVFWPGEFDGLYFPGSQKVGHD